MSNMDSWVTPDDLHLKNFVDSIHTRKQSIEGAVAAHNAVVGGTLQTCPTSLVAAK